MPYINDRQNVLDIYQEAAERKWVIPAFGTENLTTTEAILAATLEQSNNLNIPNLPITIAITNQYNHRSQSINYTHTRRWDIGLRLFMEDLKILTSYFSPFKDLNVMVLLDHAQWDTDKVLFEYDLEEFSMIMYDASSIPIDKNIIKTSEFVDKFQRKIVIEGACDEIVDSSGEESGELTSPSRAKEYLEKTNVDFMVANLGTEHRASSSDLKYQDKLAKEICELIGNKLVLHGTSSVSNNQLLDLFNDGIAKVNIWTRLERDSSPILFENMLKNSSKVAGQKKIQQLIESGYLGPRTKSAETLALSHFTTVYRQDIIFQEMKNIVLEYLNLWYK